MVSFKKFQNYGHPEIKVTFLGPKGDRNSGVPLYLISIVLI